MISSKMIAWYVENSFLVGCKNGFVLRIAETWLAAEYRVDDTIRATGDITCTLMQNILTVENIHERSYLFLALVALVARLPGRSKG